MIVPSSVISALIPKSRLAKVHGKPGMIPVCRLFAVCDWLCSQNEMEGPPGIHTNTIYAAITTARLPIAEKLPQNVSRPTVRIPLMGSAI